MIQLGLVDPLKGYRVMRVGVRVQGTGSPEWVGGSGQRRGTGKETKLNLSEPQVFLRGVVTELMTHLNSTENDAKK